MVSCSPEMGCTAYVLTTVWFAGGALVATIAAVFQTPLAVQVILFLAVSAVLLIFTRPLAVK